MAQWPEEADRHVSQIDDPFHTEWSRLVESLGKPPCLRLFRQRGIAITESCQRSEGVDDEGRRIVLDALLLNDHEVVVFQVRNKLTIEDVADLLQTLPRAQKHRSVCRDKKVYGVVAAYRFDARSDLHAARQGLFVLKSEDDLTMRIVNDVDFKPKTVFY